MLAPAWVPVPAPAYGGIEEAVRLLCDGLAERGNEVTLCAVARLGGIEPAACRDACERRFDVPAVVGRHQPHMVK